MSEANVDIWLAEWSIWWAELRHSIEEAVAIIAGAWADFVAALERLRAELADIWAHCVGRPSMAIWVRYTIAPSMAADVGGRALFRAWLADGGRAAELHRWRHNVAPWRYGGRRPMARRW